MRRGRLESSIACLPFAIHDEGDGPDTLNVTHKVVTTLISSSPSALLLVLTHCDLQTICGVFSAISLINCSSHSFHMWNLIFVLAFIYQIWQIHGIVFG